MPHKGRLAAILLALTLFGCSSKTSTASASGSSSAPADSGAAASPAPSPSTDLTFRTEPITDPTLNTLLGGVNSGTLNTLLGGIGNGPLNNLLSGRTAVAVGPRRRLELHDLDGNAPA